MTATGTDRPVFDEETDEHIAYYRLEGLAHGLKSALFEANEALGYVNGAAPLTHEETRRVGDLIDAAFPGLIDLGNASPELHRLALRMEAHGAAFAGLLLNLADQFRGEGGTGPAPRFQTAS